MGEDTHMVKPNQLESDTFENRPLQSISLHGEVRAIKGTRAANEIEIEVEHSQLVILVDGSRKTFNLCGVRRIRAIGAVDVSAPGDIAL
jgi:hypothetical protein